MDSRATGVIGGAGQGAAIGAKVGGPWGAAIGGIAGGLAGGLLGGDDDDAKELARLQAEEIRLAAEENRRIKLIEMGQVLGRAKATTYASNLIESGSSRRYTKTIEEDYRKSMAWDNRRTRMQEKMAKLGGQMAADQIQSANIRFAVQGIGAAASSGALGTFKDGAYKSPWS